jgi:hypothetical protein
MIFPWLLNRPLLFVLIQASLQIISVCDIPVFVKMHVHKAVGDLPNKENDMVG